MNDLKKPHRSPVTERGWMSYREEMTRKSRSGWVRWELHQRVKAFGESCTRDLLLSVPRSFSGYEADALATELRRRFLVKTKTGFRFKDIGKRMWIPAVYNLQEKLS